MKKVLSQVLTQKLSNKIKNSKMSRILNTLWENYNFVFYELNDDRSKNIWPNFITLITILLLYLYFIKKVGPKWMKERKPYELTKTILVYNAIQIIASAALFYDSFFNIWMKEYNWTCQPVDYSDSPYIKKAHNLIWLYMVLKLVDLLDTVFFVLRKKDRQISSLHIYHHFLMPLATWTALKFVPNGHATLLGSINCLVHTIMYTYYLIAGLGPQYEKYLWWKKHVTTLQLMQFLIIFLHNLYPLLTGCTYPKWVNVALCLSSLHFIYMFGNFYYVNYIKKPSSIDRKQL